MSLHAVSGSDRKRALKDRSRLKGGDHEVAIRLIMNCMTPAERVEVAEGWDKCWKSMVAD